MTEIERLATWSSVRTSTYHWWEDQNREVDLVLEDEDTGRLIAFEVKSARESSPRFFDGIRAFKQRYPDQFHHGVVLHCGDHPLRHADDLWSLPFSALWTIGERVAAPDEEPSDPLERALSDLRSRVALGRKTQLVLQLHGSAVLQANGVIIWNVCGMDSTGGVIFNLTTSTDWDQADLDVQPDSLLAAGTEMLGPFLDSYEGRPTQQRD